MGIHENIQTELVSQLAIREPVTASRTTTTRDAIVRMREKKLGCVIVVDDDQKPIGIFTESMITQMIAKGGLILDAPVSDVMSQQCPWVKVTDPVGDVLEAMELKNIRFLAVVDDDGRITGLTGQKGLMEYVADHFPGQVMVQRVGIKPYMEQREGA